MIPKIHTGLTERQMHRRFWLASSGSVLAGLSVALAAYAAHAGLGDKAQGNLQQAALFAFGHGVALAALAPLAVRRLAWLGLLSIAIGTLLFSGSLVLGALFGISTGAAPVGGMLMISGWLLHAIGQWRR